MSSTPAADGGRVFCALRTSASASIGRPAPKEHSMTISTVTATLSTTASTGSAPRLLDTRTTAATLAVDDATDATFRRAQQRSERIEAELHVDPTAYRVVTGDRPTGDRHQRQERQQQLVERGHC